MNNPKDIRPAELFAREIDFAMFSRCGMPLYGTVIGGPLDLIFADMIEGYGPVDSLTASMRTRRTEILQARDRWISAFERYERENAAPRGRHRAYRRAAIAA